MSATPSNTNEGSSFLQAFSPPHSASGVVAHITPYYSSPAHRDGHLAVRRLTARLAALRRR